MLPCSTAPKEPLGCVHSYCVFNMRDFGEKHLFPSRKVNPVVCKQQKKQGVQPNMKMQSNHAVAYGRSGKG